MTTFKEIIDARLHKIYATLYKKADEYASKRNRFRNFDVAARIANITPEQALYGMMLKHMESVFTIVEWTATDEECKITKDLIDEKLGDHINYLILLEGLLLRRIEVRDEKEMA